MSESEKGEKGERYSVPDERPSDNLLINESPILIKGTLSRNFSFPYQQNVTLRNSPGRVAGRHRVGHTCCI